MGGSTMRGPWPDLGGLPLGPTIGALHLWAQVVGKVRLMLTPWENHGWHVPLYVSSRGLATGLIPVPGRALTMEFDFVSSELVARTSVGGESRLALEPMSVSAFHDGLLSALDGLDIVVAIDPMPVEIAGAKRFYEDREIRDYDAGAALAYWRTLVEVHRVFQLFRTSFVGKVSPVHLFWGAFDLAVTRFSGRSAPPHPGGAPFMNDAIAREAYSREVSSAGFWPNLEGEGGPAFYSYAYPVPAGFADRAVSPSEARFDDALGEFVLPYAAVRASADPDAALLAFLQSTYEAAAELADWDRPMLECARGAIGRPPEGS